MPLWLKPLTDSATNMVLALRVTLRDMPEFHDVLSKVERSIHLTALHHQYLDQLLSYLQYW